MQKKITSERSNRGLNAEELSIPTNLPPLDGACLGRDVSIWFPYIDTDSPDPEKYTRAHRSSELAKKICNTCERQIPCLAYGLQNERWGIWGGYTERERKSLRRKFGIRLNQRDPVINIQGMNLR